MDSSRILRGESIIFLGESHTLSFADRVVLREAAAPLVCHSIFLSSAICLATVTNSDGGLAGPVRNAMRSFRLLIDEPGEEASEESVFMTPRKMWRNVARRRFTVPPLIVICLGSYDIFRTINEFPAEDFAFGETPLLHRPAPSFAVPLPDAMDAADAVAWFSARVEPLRAALQRLREVGFPRLSCLAVPPPTLDDDLTARAVNGLGGAVTPGKGRRAFRYKVAMLLNALVAQVCADEGVDFLDSWPLLTEGGIVRPDALMDAAHLNGGAVDELLQLLVVPVAERTFVAHSPREAVVG
jgi:hypothetical protein